MVEEYKIYILKKANKDKEKIKQFPALKNNVEKLINLIKKQLLMALDFAIHFTLLAALTPVLVATMNIHGIQSMEIY